MTTARAFLAATLLFATAVPDAGAQPDSGRALELFERGVQLMQNEDWDVALVQLQRSFELRSTQVALFNVGMCLKALHRYQEAIAAFDRLLREFATGGSDERRALARTEIQAMRALMGSVRIVVSVPGAEVLIDGTVVGISPIGAPVELVGGTHVIQARREGFEAAEQRVAVVAGETATVELTLREPVAPEPSDHPETLEPLPDSDAGQGPTDEPASSRRGLGPLWFWSAAGLAGAAAIATAVLGAIIVAGNADYEASNPRTFEDRDDGRRLMRITDVTLGVALVAAAAAVVLFTQTDFKQGSTDTASQQDVGLRLDLGAAPDGWAAGLSGRF